MRKHVYELSSLVKLEDHDQEERLVKYLYHTNKYSDSEFKEFHNNWLEENNQKDSILGFFLFKRHLIENLGFEEVSSDDIFSLVFEEFDDKPETIKCTGCGHPTEVKDIQYENEKPYCTVCVLVERMPKFKEAVANLGKQMK